MLKKSSSNPKFTHIFLGFLFLIFVSVSTMAQDEAAADPAVIAAGEKLYKSNCTACHAINDIVIGPALGGVNERRDREWLVAWIQNSQKLIQSGDETAVELFEQFNKTAMPAYPFSEDEVVSILEYIKVEEAKQPEVVVDAAAGTGGGEQAGEQVSGYVNAVMIGLVVVLVLILVVLTMIVSVLTKYLKDQKELDESDLEVVDQKLNLGKLIRSDLVVGAAIFIFSAVALKTLIDGAYTIGIQQGYQPTQPIAFSHQLHAGEYEIDCKYCHTGVTKGKSANIPSPNICMNCHVSIKTDSKEIEKIYAAIDYDPSTGQYGDNTKPIEWVRIHNLPDLAYFNHSQHVVVGDIECQTCHGPIEEMEVVYQHANLTMGWCINCHRETDVNTKGNGYYDKLVKLHAEKSKEPMKVEDIGGLECSKCHY
ncbi:MAG: c-type cytochrome [Cyclobacteriaceae bacterium]